MSRHALDDRLTRGGPLALNAAWRSVTVFGGTDERKGLSVKADANINSDDADGWSRRVSLSFNLKPASGLMIELGPEWNRSYGIAQYVGVADDATAVQTFGRRYVFSAIDQWQLSMTTRVNVIFTPRLSLQVFMQPLLASGDYNSFRELARPRTLDFLEYGVTAGSLAFDPASRIYTADPDGASGAARAFTFEDPDYNFKSLRVNAVFKWEMRPGSNFYAVWTRQQQNLSNPGRFAPGPDARALFRAPGDDIILFKMSYWIGR
jgi:hypothetical protein